MSLTSLLRGAANRLGHLEPDIRKVVLQAADTIEGVEEAIDTWWQYHRDEGGCCDLAKSYEMAAFTAKLRTIIAGKSDAA